MFGYKIFCRFFDEKLHTFNKLFVIVPAVTLFPFKFIKRGPVKAQSKASLPAQSIISF